MYVEDNMTTRLTGSGITFNDGTTQTTQGVEFDSGTVTVFYQSAAPTNWTKVTTHNDKTMRVVSGTGGGSGGSVAFTSVFTSRTFSGSIGNTTLSTSQIPSHNHNTLHTQDIAPWGTGGGSSGKYMRTEYLNTDWAYTSSTGGGGSHNHSFSGNAIDFSVQYVDVILASKN